MSRADTSRMRRRAILAGFLVSGVTGLVYQSIWIRMLTLIIGGTTAALTTVLIAFMGGLALGSFLLGGFADRTRNPLRAYAVAEAAIGIYALILPALYRAVPGIYQSLDALDPVHGPVFDALRFCLALTFFGIPATLMGGTLPLVVKAMSERATGLQVTVAEVYAINTFGATLGAFLSGFVVLPTLGLYSTLYATAAVNLLLGAGFWFVLGAGRGLEARVDTASVAEAELWARSGASPSGSPTGEAGAGGRKARVVDPAAEPVTTRSPARAGRPELLVIFFLMGASSLSYEVLWHRLLGLSFGNSVYAVSTMLTSFLLGIGLGSWWLRARAARFPPSWATLGWIEVAIAVAAPLTAWLLTVIPHGVQYLFLLPYLATRLLGDGAADFGFWVLQFALFCVGTAVMLLPTCLMGASFPLAVRLYASDDVGASVGRVYASNTFGSIAGLFLTGFVFIQAFGTEVTNYGWSAVNGVLGLGLLTIGLRDGMEPARRRRLLRFSAAALLAVGVATPSWSLEALTSGVYYHVIELESPTLKGKITFHTEDEMGLISIHESRQPGEPDPVHTIKVNGKFMAEDGHRLPVLHLDAHIPVFMHAGKPASALVIGLGGGYTAEATLMHPFERVDVAEISPGVIDAAKLNRPKIFDDPRLRIVTEDARALLLTGEQKYDVIVSETSDPWMTGVANLYTVECFQWIRNKLAPGGVFGTWLQTRHKRVEDVKLILRTMRSVFPHMAVFEPDVGDLLIVMSGEPLRLDVDFLKQRHTELKHEMLEINMSSPWSLMGRLVMGEQSVATYLGEGPINTDELPVIEFRTPRSLNIGLKGQEIWDDLVGHAPAAPDLPMTGAGPADEALWRVHRALHLEWFDRALEALTEAERLEAAPDPYLRARVLFALKRYDEALELSRTLTPSLRQAMLEAGALTMLERRAELLTQLREGAGWGVSPENGWDRLILYRRQLLLDALGAASVSAAAPSPGQAAVE